MRSFRELIIGIAVVSVFVFSGCGGGSDGGGSDTTPSTTNKNPVASAGADQTVTQNDTVNLDASSSTDDGSIVSYRWSEGAIELSTSMSFNITTLSVGTHTITLLVTDNQGATDTDAVSITVNAPTNQVPVADAQSIIADENTAKTITLSATDGDTTDTLTYTVVSQPSNGSLSGTAPNLTYTPTTGYSGSDSFTFKVNDGTVDSATVTVNITVNEDTSIPTITSPITGYVWMDRNLGASQACTSFDDTACYGDYYQWGRDTDGHEKSNRATVEVTSSQTNINPGHAKFITDGDDNSDDGAERDWISNDADGSKRASWNPCPSGFRIPTRAEIDAEYNSGNGIGNRSEAFDKLKLPSAGYRDNDSGSLYGQGSYGFIWSSGVSGSYSGDLFFGSTDAGTGGVSRAYGLSVRCFKD